NAAYSSSAALSWARVASSRKGFMPRCYPPAGTTRGRSPGLGREMLPAAPELLFRTGGPRLLEGVQPAVAEPVFMLPESLHTGFPQQLAGDEAVLVVAQDLLDAVRAVLQLERPLAAHGCRGLA